MSASTPRFAIVFESAGHGLRTALKMTNDANEATVAYHAALNQLRSKGFVGDVLLRIQDHEPMELLRQPVIGASR